MSTAQNPAAPATGRAFPQSDEAASDRATAALEAFKTISVPHPRQEAIMTSMDVLRRRHLGGRGRPMKGLRLSQVSQAGKSHTAQRYVERLKGRTMLETGAANPHQVLYVGLETRITVKQLCVKLLRMLGDPKAHEGNEDLVKQRLREFIERFGVELLIVDEVQHLKNETIASVDVTDELKRFLDLGIVPVVFLGNEESLTFFERNTQLASRLGTPLELAAVDVDQNDQLLAFMHFCEGLDTAMEAAGCTRRASGFGDALILQALLRASGGMLGRVCRIVEEALEHASLRDAEFVEAYDLSRAIDTFAIPLGYTNENPFARCQGPANDAKSDAGAFFSKAKDAA